LAEWGVLRAGRRRADKGRYALGCGASDRRSIRAAIKFMTWLDGNSITLADLGQGDLDLWVTTNPTRRRDLKPFIGWAVARRLTSKVTIPTKKYGLPSRFLHGDELNQQLRRCLNDDSFPPGSPHYRLPDQPLCPTHHAYRRAHDRPVPPGRRRRLPDGKSASRPPPTQTRCPHRTTDHQSGLPHLRASAVAERGFVDL
jgi:hypothetical protein